MRVFINAVSARAGGGVSYLIHLIDCLPQAAPEDEFIVAIPDIALFRKYSTYKNIRIIKVKEASGNLIERYLWENTKLIELCKSTKADILFCVANIMPLINPGIPVVVMIQNVAPLTPRVRKTLFKYEGIHKSLQMLLLQALTMHALKKANRIISLSHATNALLKKWQPNLESDVLYHGINTIFNPNASRPEKAGNEEYFLYVSNLYVYKGLEYIVDALAHDKGLPNVFVAGSEFDLNYISFVKNRAREKGVQNRIIFLSNVKYEQLPGWYSNAKAMVYTSWCENCPNILLESMGCSCPVVSMNIGPMKEICGEAGYYAKPFDGKSLAIAMREAMDEKNIETKKKAAQKRAAEFTWERAMQDHVKVFRSML